MTGVDTVAGTSALDAPPVEREIAADMIRRAWPLLPALVVVGAVFWGVAGALSAGFAIAIVVLNLLASAALLAWAGRISLGLLMAVALVGFVVRLGIITAAVLAVEGQWWVELVPLCGALLITHLGLLIWETRHVSASLAFPGLKPAKG